MIKRWAWILILISIVIVYSGFFRESKRSDTGHDHSDEYHEHSHRAGADAPPKMMLPSREPDRVIINTTDRPETSVAINWRTDTTVSENEIQWAVATAGPEFLSTIRTLQAGKEYFTGTSWRRTRCVGTLL